MPHVVIVSDDKVFGDALCDLIARELSCDTTLLPQIIDLNDSKVLSADAIVTVYPTTTHHDLSHLIIDITKPQRAKMLLKRIVDKIYTTAKEEILLRKNIVILPQYRMLKSQNTDKSVELTEKEQSLLLYIFNNSEPSRETILHDVWGIIADIDTHTLETHIYRLRQKWRELDNSDPIMVTESGYRWNHDE